MNENLENIKMEIKTLCEEFNRILKRLEEQNVITHEEYLIYSAKKIEFLKT